MISYAINVYIGIVESFKYFGVHLKIGDGMKEVILKMDDKIDITAAFDAFKNEDKQLIAFRDGCYYALKESPKGTYRWLSLVCANAYWSVIENPSEADLMAWFKRAMNSMDTVWVVENPEDQAKIFK